MELLRLVRAEIGFRTPLLQPIDLGVSRGQRLAVLGPNGGGKTTLLRSLIGLQQLLSGERVLPGGPAPRVGYVSQAHRADPVFPLTAFEVVLQGRYGLVGVGRFVRAADRAAAEQQLAAVGLSEVARQPFRALSGGQRQRVLLARALCGEPELLVLDEFTSDLDPAATSALLGEVSRLSVTTGVAVVFVTHEISAASSWSTDVALIDSRSRIFESGPADALLTTERLSRLYGQTVKIERRDGKTVVYVETTPLRQERAP